jgi:hypothetical protein
MIAQLGHDGWWDRDGTAAGFRLWRFDRESRIGLFQRPLDTDLAVVEIDISPAKCNDFTTAHARCETGYDDRIERPAAQRIENGLDLVRSEYLGFGALDPWRLGRSDGVIANNSPFDRARPIW